MTVGIDLAKNVFAVHGVDEHGNAILITPKVMREQLLPMIVRMPCPLAQSMKVPPMYSVS